jgi:hypothetical protein
MFTLEDANPHIVFEIPFGKQVSYGFTAILEIDPVRRRSATIYCGSL